MPKPFNLNRGRLICMAEELTYASSGVNIDEAQRALRGVVDKIRATQGEEVLGGVGGFGALFNGVFPNIAKPLLVSSIDGVGTKTKVAAMAGDYSNLGRDIVNHCVNDILCQGARPLFFLDYYGCSRLSGPVFDAVVSGIADSCLQVGCALIGGVYHDEEVDIVGSIVGVVDAENLFPKNVPAGSAVIGIASNGLHTNGFSLARRALFEVAGFSVRDLVPGTQETIAEALLKPHRCYFNSVYPLMQEGAIQAVAHLTGGGFYDNIPRVLSNSVRVFIEKQAWTPPAIFQLIQNSGNIADPEMYRTFNMGIGMVVFAERTLAPTIVEHLHQQGEHAAIIGEVQAGNGEVQLL
jgi:phosphoribosylformylglycinamidine cyclo-ligase